MSTDFESWRQQVERHSPESAAAVFQDKMFLEHSFQGSMILIYPGPTWIEETTPGSYMLTLEREYHEDSLEALELKLWSWLCLNIV